MSIFYLKIMALVMQLHINIMKGLREVQVPLIIILTFCFQLKIINRKGINRIDKVGACFKKIPFVNLDNIHIACIKKRKKILETIFDQI